MSGVNRIESVQFSFTEEEMKLLIENLSGTHYTGGENEERTLQLRARFKDGLKFMHGLNRLAEGLDSGVSDD